MDRREHHLRRVLLGLRPDLAGRRRAVSTPAGLSSRSGAPSWTPYWRVTRAGATSGDLARAAIAANGGTKPWLPHFYLGHGIGTYPAETPMIGTDLGEEFDDNFVFPAGMVLVLEPVVWEDGTGGYRSEEIVVITEDGYQSITDYPYTPYGVLRPRPTTGHYARRGANAHWLRCGPTAWTCWCWGVRPTSATSPASRSCGWRAPVHSHRSAFSTVPPAKST